MNRVLATAISKAGSSSKLARRLRESPQTITNWKQRGVSIRARAKVRRAAAR